MPAKRTDTDTVKFSITLPAASAEALESLAPLGLYGGSRADIARNLILRKLQELHESGSLPPR